MKLYTLKHASQTVKKLAQGSQWDLQAQILKFCVPIFFHNVNKKNVFKLESKNLSVLFQFPAHIPELWKLFHKISWLGFSFPFVKTYMLSTNEYVKMQKFHPAETGILKREVSRIL